MEMNVKKNMAKGIYYSAIAKYSSLIFSLIVVAILSRILDYKDFGIVAIASVILNFLSTFTSLGLEPAIIQHKELEQKDYSNIFSFTFWTGIIITIIFFGLSWPISKFYDNSALLYICQILSIQLFFSTINIVPNSLLFKNKEFRFIAFRTLGVQMIGGAGAIIAALSGLGLYSLIINPVFSSVIIFILNFRKYPNRLSLSFGIETISKIFTYSSYQFLFGLINYFSRNLDKLIIGKQLGMTPLGFYEKSYRLMMLPLQNISHVIGPVMHPIFSDFQNNLQYLSSSYEKVVRILALIGFPLAVILFFNGSELIILFFGNNWTDSIMPFKILTLSVGTQIILATSGSIFQATNSTKALFISGLINTSVTVLGMILAINLYKSINAVAWSISITFILNFILTYTILYYYILKRKLLFLLKQVVPGLLLSSILILINIIVSQYILNIHLFLSLVIKSGISITISLIYIQLTKEYNIYELIVKYIKPHNKKS
ncbi:MAG: lipopolysaccharide biosynthesis protein [Bacteroidales bacterium]|nr:lipopolysaccharide biosynthesis protein [Bacteroidales bacterium]